MSENMTNKNVEEAKKEEYVPYSIDVTPLPFQKHMEGRITSTLDLKNLVGQLFTACFNDYVGCNIYVMDGSIVLPGDIVRFMTPGSLYVDIYFEKNASKARSGILDNLETPKESNSGLNRLRNVCNNNTRMWYLTKETKEALLEFLPGSNMRGYNPCWDIRSVEEAVSNSNIYAQPTVCLKVIGLDLNAIVAKIYGTKEDPDDPKSKVIYDYQCMPIARSNKGMVYGYRPDARTEFVVQILRNNLSIIGATQDALGVNAVIPTTNGFTRYVAN